MSDIIQVTVTDFVGDVTVTVLDSNDIFPVTAIFETDEITVNVFDVPSETFNVSVFTDPLDEVFVTLTDGVSDQDLHAKMEDWHWPKSVDLEYLQSGELSTVTKETGEVLQLNRTSGTLTSISSSKGWTKTLNYTGDKLTSVTVS